MRRGAAYRRASANDYGLWKRSNVRKQRPPKHPLMIDVRLRETSYCCVGPYDVQMGKVMHNLDSSDLDEDIPKDAPCRCRRGDIYLQRGNTKELVGTAALFDSDASDFIYPDLMIRVRADESRSEENT